MYAHKLLLTEKSPADLHLTNGFSSCPEWLPRIEPSESSHTLGVHLSPSGCQKHLCQVLWHHAKFYCDQIASSYVTPTEAFLSYFLYIRPKINYPLSCTGLTTVQALLSQLPQTQRSLIGPTQYSAIANSPSQLATLTAPMRPMDVAKEWYLDYVSPQLRNHCKTADSTAVQNRGIVEALSR